MVMVRDEWQRARWTRNAAGAPGIHQRQHKRQLQMRIFLSTFLRARFGDMRSAKLVAVALALASSLLLNLYLLSRSPSTPSLSPSPPPPPSPSLSTMVNIKERTYIMVKVRTRSLLDLVFGLLNSIYAFSPTASSAASSATSSPVSRSAASSSPLSSSSTPHPTTSRSVCRFPCSSLPAIDLIAPLIRLRRPQGQALLPRSYQVHGFRPRRCDGLGGS